MLVAPSQLRPRKNLAKESVSLRVRQHGSTKCEPSQLKVAFVCVCVPFVSGVFGSEII